jgi:hypothetical protein
MSQKPKSSLEERIAALHAEIEELITRHLDRVAAEFPGVPRDIARQVEIEAFARSNYCPCKAAKLLAKSALRVPA